MSIILSVETSTTICSVAIHNEGELMACQELFLERSHSSRLVMLIQDIIKQCGLTLKEISAFAISMGPGSYTGLRIGTSTIKGLCYGLDKPLIAVNTLDAMAYGMSKHNHQNALLCPMIDARRMEVYCLVADAELNEISPTMAKIIDESSFREYLSVNKMLFFGNGAEKCRQTLGDKSNALFEDGGYPSALQVGFLAYRRFKENRFEDVAYFEPFYLKAFRAGKPKQELKR